MQRKVDSQPSFVTLLANIYCFSQDLNHDCEEGRHSSLLNGVVGGIFTKYCNSDKLSIAKADVWETLP